jgi:hypothetical protein
VRRVVPGRREPRIPPAEYPRVLFHHITVIEAGKSLPMKSKKDSTE